MKQQLKEQIIAYEKQYPRRKNLTQRALNLLEKYSDTTAFMRHCFDDGHFTGSMLVMNKEKTKVLLMHHKKFGTWQQFGGHVDGEMDLRSVAIRELEEESGVDISQVDVQKDILYMDIHCVPAHQSEPEHFHYDLGYLAIADEDIVFLKHDEEVHEISWFDIHSVKSQTQSGKYSSGLCQMLEHV